MSGDLWCGLLTILFAVPTNNTLFDSFARGGSVSHYLSEYLSLLSCSLAILVYEFSEDTASRFEHSFPGKKVHSFRLLPSKQVIGSSHIILFGVASNLLHPRLVSAVVGPELLYLRSTANA